MKRPLAVIGFSYSSALLAAFLFGFVHIIAAVIISGTLFVISLFLPVVRKLPYVKGVLFSVLAAMTVLYFYNIAYVERTDFLMENEVHIRAEICDLPYEQNNRVYYTLKTTQIDFPDCPQNIKIRVSSAKALRAEPYDIIEASVKIYSRSGTQRYSDIARGIMLRGSLAAGEKVSVEKQETKPLYYYAVCIRKRIFDIIDMDFPRELSPFMKALMTGDKSSLSGEELAVFRDAGIMHIIAASGFHLAVLTGMISAVIMFLLKCRRNTASLICAGFVFVYMAVVGFTPSIMRAGIMTIISLLGRFAFREADSLNSLGAACLVICFIDPYAVCDTGFLLSVSATFGIIVLEPKLTGRLTEFFQPKGSDKKTLKRTRFFVGHEKVIRTAVSFVTVPVSAIVFTYPVNVICFRYFAPYSLIANLLTSFAASLLLSLLFILVILQVSVIFSFLKLPFIILCGLLCKYIIGIAGFIAGLPYSGMKASYEYVPVVIALIFAVTAVYRFAMKNRKRRTLSVMTAAAFLLFTVGSSLDTAAKADSKKVSVLDTGSGISVILSKNNDSAVLSCGGSYDKISEIVTYLSDTSVDEIRYMLITDTSAECSAYAENILKNYNVRTVQAYDEEKYYDRLHSLVMESEEVILSKSDTKQTESFICCGTEIQVYKTDKCNALRFSADGTVYLICHRDTDCSQLPMDFRKADVMIIDGISENMECISASYAIVSDSPANLENDIEGSELGKAKLYYTAGYGNIGIRHYGNGKISIRRENDWLN